MTFPAIIAAATSITPSTSTVNRRTPPPLSCRCSYNSSSSLTFRNPNPSNRRSSLVTYTKSTASDSTTIVDDPITKSSSEEDKIQSKIGARVRVSVPLKVYHIPKVPELDLNGKEGKLKEYIAVWKGKHISANLPYKIEFFEVLEGRGDAPVKFFAHLKEDEFEYLD